MPKLASKKRAYTSEALCELVIDSILDKKGEEVLLLDLREIDDAVADYFIICEGAATTQVKAIAENVSRSVKTTYKDSPWHTEGLQNLEWVLLDYVNVVVHVFQKHIREHYALEDLWSDARITRHDPEM